MDNFENKKSEIGTTDNHISGRGLTITAAVMLFIRACVLVYLAGANIYRGIFDTVAAGFSGNRYFISFIYAGVITVFIVLDILACVKLIKGKKTGKGIGIFTTSIIFAYLLVIFITASYRILFILPLIYNFIVMIVLILALDRMKRIMSVQLAQPLVEYKPIGDSDYISGRRLTFTAAVLLFIRSGCLISIAVLFIIPALYTIIQTGNLYGEGFELVIISLWGIVFIIGVLDIVAGVNIIKGRMCGKVIGIITTLFCIAFIGFLIINNWRFLFLILLIYNLIVLIFAILARVKIKKIISSQMAQPIAEYKQTGDTDYISQ